MLTPQDNERLTRVGPGTPMGNVFRSYWIPAALSAELPQAGGPPIRVRLLGEDLVAFRDAEGNAGLVKAKVTSEGYPAWEGGGMVWTFMGPADAQPAPPDHELVRAPATHRFVSKTHQACNYLQALEGAVDPTHATILHNNDIGDREWLKDFHSTVADIELEKTDYGYTYAGNRVRDSERWVRVYHYIMPSLQMRGTVEGYFSTKGHAPTIDGHIWAPIDDYNVFVYNWMYSYDPSGPIPIEQALAQEIRLGRGPDDYVAGTFQLKRNATNDYLIDRNAQKHQSFTGIKGVNTQDVALQEQMGPIVDRSKEHLGASDRAIIVMRQLLMEATHAVENGETPRGVDPQTYRHVRAVDRKIPLDADWKDAVKEDLYARF